MKTYLDKSFLCKRVCLKKYYTSPLLFVFYFLAISEHSFAQKAKNASRVQEYTEQGEAEWEISNFGSALDLFTKAIKLDSTRGDIFFRRAKSYLFLKKYEASTQDLQRADSLGAGNTETCFYWGVAYFHQQLYQKALIYLEKALDKGYENDSFYAYLAETYKFLGERKKALVFYQKAIQSNPKETHLYWLRANYYAKEKLADLALHDLDEIHRLEPRHWQAYALKAHIYFLDKKDDKSIENRLLYLKNIVDKKSISATEYDLLAYSYAQTKQIPLALESMGKAIALDSQNPEYYFERATYWIENKNYKKALEDCQKSITLTQADDEDLTYFRQRAFLYRTLSQYQNALEDYTFLSQQDEQDADNHYFLAEMKFRLKKTPKEFQKDVQTAFQLGYPKEKMQAELKKYAERRVGWKRWFGRRN